MELPPPATERYGLAGEANALGADLAHAEQVIMRAVAEDESGCFDQNGLTHLEGEIPHRVVIVLAFDAADGTGHVRKGPSRRERAIEHAVERRVGRNFVDGNVGCHKERDAHYLVDVAERSVDQDRGPGGSNKRAR